MYNQTNHKCITFDEVAHLFRSIKFPYLVTIGGKVII